MPLESPSPIKLPPESSHLIKKLFRRGTSPARESLNASSSATPAAPSHHHHPLSKLLGLRSHKLNSPTQKLNSPTQKLNSPTHDPPGLSYLKLLHNHHAPQRTRSISDAHPRPATAHKTLSKAETVAHLDSSLKLRQPPKGLLLNTKLPHSHAYLPPLSASSTHERTNHDKIVYNPYGTNRNSVQAQTPKNTSFYMQGGAGDGPRILNQPVADPNDYLPEHLKQPCVDLLDTFEMESGADKKLGDGGSSDVRIVNAKGHKRQLFALKQFVLLPKESDEQFYKRVAQEYVLSHSISALRHVVDIFGLVRIPTQQNVTRGWGMILEVCSNGDLFNAIVKSGWKRQPLCERYCIFKQIAHGLQFLHKADVVHRDMKPENVLLDKNGVAKLCDFGVSTHGHEIPQDFLSPIRKSSQYVGSPPYSPPEVMLLKEKPSAEAKNFEYDPFKMDCWGLGMLLFCIVYGAVPFHAALAAEHAYRDYKFNFERFVLDHPSFKSNTEYAKGPSLEFKWATQFQSTGALRVAWKLCNPSAKNRYTLDDLFSDPWFTSLEMCLYEDPDQSVNPFVLSGTGPDAAAPLPASNSSIYSEPPSRSGLQVPSRRGTLYQMRAHEDLPVEHVPVKSLLDHPAATPALGSESRPALAESSPLLLSQRRSSVDPPGSTKKTNISSHSPVLSEAPAPRMPVRSMLDFADDLDKKKDTAKLAEHACDCDDTSIHSASSLSHEPFAMKDTEPLATRETESPSPPPRPPNTMGKHASSSTSSANLPAVQEDKEESAILEEGPAHGSASSSPEHRRASPDQKRAISNSDHAKASLEIKKSSPVKDREELESRRLSGLSRMSLLKVGTPQRSASLESQVEPKAFISGTPPTYTSIDTALDSNGTCDLGYKIKKHHHQHISNVNATGTWRR